MSRIPLLDLDSLRQGPLAGPVEAALRDGAPDPAFYAFFGHNPQLAVAVNSLARAVYGPGHLSQELKELIRLKLSLAAESNY